MTAPPRSRLQRRRDTEHRLAHDIDVWVASASVDGAPYLAPLSFDWDGEALLVSTLLRNGRWLVERGEIDEDRDVPIQVTNEEFR